MGKSVVVSLNSVHAPCMYRWTFQATRMDGQLGGIYILPDQMQVINAALILIYIPIFDKGVYPLASE